MDRVLTKPLFSIVIPIYKVEQYLNKCVDSILSQNFFDYEIILVDDGSPDQCPKICDHYAEIDDRIHVIHKENGGSSSTRNCGTRAAKGSYIIYVDSDDYWNDNYALSTIADKIVGLGTVDVLMFNNVDYSCLTGECVVCNRVYDIEKLETSTKEEVLRYIFGNGLFPGAAWVVVTRRAFLKENNISFIEGIKAEDVDWLLNVFLAADRFSAVNKAFYVYQKYRGGSITGTADKKSIDDILYTINIWTSKLEEQKYAFIKSTVLGFLCNHYMCAVLIYENLSADQKKECKDKLRHYQYLVGYFPSLAVRICGRLPLSVLSKILNLYRKGRKF